METKQEQVWRDDEAEIDLVQLLVELLKNIKPILICAVVCGLLFGGAKLGLGLYAEYRAKNAPVEEDTTLNKYGVGGMVGVSGMQQSDDGEYKTKAEREYEQKLETYKLQVASYQDQLSKVLKLVSRNEEYKRSSVLLNMDPNNFYQKDAVWYVDTHYQVNPSLSMQNPDPINSIMSAYETLLTSEDFYSYVQENTSDEIDALNLRELIFTEANAETAFIKLTALGATEQMANEIFDASVKYLESHKPMINNAVSRYDVTLIEEWGYGSFDTEASESIIGGGYADYIKEKQDGFNDTLAELQTAAVELQQNLLKLEEPKNPGSSQLKSFVKNGVIGGVLGVILAGIYIVIRFIAKDAALSEDELRRRYGVIVLSSVKRFPGKGTWQKMLSRMSGDAKRSATVEEAAGLAQANIVSILEANGQKDGKVLLVGKDTIVLSEVERLTAGKQNGSIVAGGDVMTDKDAVETLRGYENVVVVERKEETSYREIGRELEKLALLNKKVVGLIAL